jgi:hypothetical protein
MMGEKEYIQYSGQEDYKKCPPGREKEMEQYYNGS